MIRRILARWAARRAHQQAMAKVYQGQCDLRQGNREAWYYYHRVKG